MNKRIVKQDETRKEWKYELHVCPTSHKLECGGRKVANGCQEIIKKNPDYV